MSEIIRPKLLIVLASLIYCCCACKQQTPPHIINANQLRGESEIHYDASKQKQIVERIYAGSLVPDSNGVVTLPSDLASAAKYGCVYVTQVDNRPILILVPTWIGKGSNVLGYLYCKHPFQASDTYVDSYGKKAIDLNVPYGKEKSVVSVQVLKTIDDKTLYVSRSLD